MGNNEDKPDATPAKNDLLDELESIKGLLDDSFDDDMDLEFDIPILDDVVPSPEAPGTDEKSLLDLEHIFDEVDLEDLDIPTDPPIQSPQDDLDLNDIEFSDFGLQGLDLEAIHSDIEMPDFKLHAEIINPDIESEQVVHIEQGKVPDTVESDQLLSDDQHDSLEFTIVDDSSANDMQWIDDDPVSDQPLSTTDTIKRNTEEEQHEALAPKSPSPSANKEKTINLEFLIQEIVDEFIPQIEDQLRRRLSTYSAEAIKQLADKQLGK